MTELLIGEELPDVLVPIVVGLAHEGVPVCAIARATKRTADAVRVAIQDALILGQITRTPKEDWPTNVLVPERTPEFLKRNKTTDEELVFSCTRMFRLTPLQAALLALLCKKTEATKESLHRVVEQRRSPSKDETDLKMVDVVICHLRKRIKKYGLTITTVWGRGYFMEPSMQKKLLGMVDEFLAGEKVSDNDKKTTQPVQGAGGKEG